MEILDIEVVRDILLILAVNSKYAPEIINDIPSIAFLANENESLNKALKKIIDNTHDQQSHTISLCKDNKDAIELIHNFFEYIYFTSSHFLKDLK